MTAPRHQRKLPSNDNFAGESARGECFFEIRKAREKGIAVLDVRWSCVNVHQGEIPVSWLSELVAIATAHRDGIAGFLRDHACGVALMVDPA